MGRFHLPATVYHEAQNTRILPVLLTDSMQQLLSLNSKATKSVTADQSRTSTRSRQTLPCLTMCTLLTMEVYNLSSSTLKASSTPFHISHVLGRSSSLERLLKLFPKSISKITICFNRCCISSASSNVVLQMGTHIE